MAVPYTFGSATSSIPLSQLDSNFATAITLGNTAVQLGNTITNLTGVSNVASATSLSLGSNGNTTAITVDTSQNVGIGTASLTAKFTVAGPQYDNKNTANIFSYDTTAVAADIGGGLMMGGYYTGTAPTAWAAVSGLKNNATSGDYGGYLAFKTRANGSLLAEAMRIDSSGGLRVGTTSAIVASSEKLTVAVTGATNAGVFANGGGATDSTVYIVNQSTSGNNLFTQFATEAGAGTVRGSITYNRAGGLTVYNTTSDYRAKDISGSVTNSGALIDSIPVYMGKMKWATEERPMFIAHEVPSYAHTGEKDAVDKDGNPVYQQMDASALIPVMWAEIQSLRQRLAAAGI